MGTMNAENSNGSSNMVINESCTTTHNSVANPFKDLDECWHLEENSRCRNGENTSTTKDATTNELKLTVPKFMLRVPKQFQKSVDVALSSTDSEQDEEYGENEDESFQAGKQAVESNYKNSNNAGGAQSAFPGFHFGINIATAISYEESLSHNGTDGDNSNETANPNLIRILQEIERTKLDIQRTKKTLHHTLKLKQSPPVEPMTPTEYTNRNWTPTPPTSPKQAPLSLPQSDQNEESRIDSMESEKEPFKRKHSQGSDVMDIDDTITGSTSQEPPRESIDEKLQRTLFAKSKAELNMPSNYNSVLNISNTILNIPKSPSTAESRMNIDISPKTKNEHTLSYDYILKPEEGNDQQGQLSNSKENLAEMPADGIELANEDVLVVDLKLDRPLDKIENVELVRICLKAVYPICLYCNHARRIAVNGQSLVLHMLAHHRFSATVDSITAEELKPETICAKLKTFLPMLENEFFNSTSYCTIGDGIFIQHFNERIFECFQCRFVTSTHKELYLHNRKMHLKTAILCFMCRANFYSFSEILCHICPGASNKIPIFDTKFRCCLCDMDNIPSPFRLMVHLRKRHCVCDVCLEDCRDQGTLSSHVWKHKLHHLCYRCGIAYRNKMDITKHLFWKHGTESIICKKCLQKRWRHVYHFCVPPTTFNCDVCYLCFSSAMYLNVHKRLHSGDFRYPCTEENCDEKFISRRLLLKHTKIHLQQEKLVEAEVQFENLEGIEKKFAKAENESEVSEMESTIMQRSYGINHGQVENSTEINKPVFLAVSEADCFVRIENSKFSNLKRKTDSKLDVSEPVEEVDISKKEKETSKGEKFTNTSRKRKKKNKRLKESLEDLNLIAPNLSETDSSQESGTENRSRGDENSLAPVIMFSPHSENQNNIQKLMKLEVSVQEEQVVEEKENVDSVTGKVLEIWKKVIQAQHDSTYTNTNEITTIKSETFCHDVNHPIPISLHVVYSDHDYCKMFSPYFPKPPTTENVDELTFISPSKPSKISKSPRLVSNRYSAVSSSSNSSTSSDSSCSCGSKCSCSSSNSESSSSSSSSANDDSSTMSNVSRKKHRKKCERDRLRKKNKNFSLLKKHLKPETINIINDELANVSADNKTNKSHLPPPKEPQIYESDLETAASETDEEFYDEHPQKLASELLAKKRAQLMARTRLSPSHTFDIVENSRPSTPSLPEEIVCETRVKLKKKKRDRKSSTKTMSILVTKTESLIEGPPVPFDLHKFEKASANATEASRAEHLTMLHSSPTVPTLTQLALPPMVSHVPGRLSEGSSCSDVDGSLKRSKRTRRPNKFYGYTSDDENSTINLGQPLIIGMRAIKPQPPPLLTWRKEDLPTPSKSVVHPKGKTVRTIKTSGMQSLSGALQFNSVASTLMKKNHAVRSADKQSTRKRIPKMPPPVPTLKIRPSLIGISNEIADSGNTAEHNLSQDLAFKRDTDDNDDKNNSEFSSEGEYNAAFAHPNSEPMTSNLGNASINFVKNSSHQIHHIQPSVPQTVLPTPEATVFNHKIPPALLPNPNFETLQYFKANNIRYPIRPPAGARLAREGESVYCYCRCPYDEVSEMIACDGGSCLIEWFHFECVGIMVAPQGKWFCAECRPKYSEELYPASGNI